MPEIYREKMLKILHLFDLYLPNTMNWAYRMIRATPDTDPWAAAPWMVRNKYFTPDIRLFVRPLQRRLTGLPPTEWRHARWVNQLLRLEHRRPFYRQWLLQQLRHRRPDVLHAHFGPIGYHYLPLAKALGIPLVVSFYGYDLESLTARKPVWKTRYHELFQAAAAVICLGPHGREVLIRQGCPPEKITVVPMSIPPEAFPWQERIKKTDALRLVQVATIREKKGYMYTLQAFRKALPHCPNLHLTLAGEENDRALQRQMQEFIQTHRLGNHVTWLGFMPPDQLPAFFGQQEVFIHPSCYTAGRDSEGAPAVILEAQATGLPVISTRHADIPSEVVHEKTGLLAEERDVAALAAHIERFYRMGNAEYRGFSMAGREHVERHFDVAKNAQILKELYERLIHPT